MANAPEWLKHLNGNPLPWLLEDSNPGVRAATLTRLMGRSPSDPEVAELRRQAHGADPIKAILDAQDVEGWWVKPGPGYGPKYSGTVWNLIFLDQLGADASDPRIQRAVDYVLRFSTTSSGGFGASGSHLERQPPPSSAAHCINGNLLRAVINFGRLDEPPVRKAIQWTTQTITGTNVERWYASGTSGPGFACAANDGQPCAWGAIKELRALAAVPPRRRTASVRAAVDVGIEFLFSRDPARADYPMGYGNTKPSGSWFKLGFPSGYICDVLETLETLTELNQGSDERLQPALKWLLDHQDHAGRWRNQRSYHGKMVIDFETQGAPSKWVTLRACTVIANSSLARRSRAS